MKRFEEYLKEKVVKKVTPDINRANSLKKEALNRKNFIFKLLETQKLNDENANYFIELAYDVIIELVRGKMLEKGFVAIGNYAHEAEVSFLGKLGLSEDKILLLDDLRKIRNKILYYGKKFDKQFALKVLNLMKEMVKKLA